MSPRIVSIETFLITGGMRSRGFFRIISNKLPRPAYSVTIHNGSLQAPIKRTILGWCNFVSIITSFSIFFRGSEVAESKYIFTATMVSWYIARLTTLLPPCAIGGWIMARSLKSISQKSSISLNFEDAFALRSDVEPDSTAVPLPALVPLWGDLSGYDMPCGDRIVLSRTMSRSPPTGSSAVRDTSLASPVALSSSSSPPGPGPAGYRSPVTPRYCTSDWRSPSSLSNASLRRLRRWRTSLCTLRPSTTMRKKASRTIRESTTIMSRSTGRSGEPSSRTGLGAGLGEGSGDGVGVGGAGTTPHMN
mmetsp:Transcript_17882/g.50363  ORF Transcript_17882/g.50363 Transcript_17882/m.50363 type:complete len:305 (-) Transcript_17882:1456-2370(-)